VQRQLSHFDLISIYNAARAQQKRAQARQGLRSTQAPPAKAEKTRPPTASKGQQQKQNPRRKEAGPRQL